MTTYQLSAMPAYAYHKKSTVPHLSVSDFSQLTAFRAGPRRDPLSRETHIHALAERGALRSKASTPFGSSILPISGVVVPPGRSYESDILEHSRRERLMPAVGESGVLSSGAAGAYHPDLGHVGEEQRSRTVPVTPHYGRLASGQTEEQNRLLLITNERARRHSSKRWEPTDTLGFNSDWRAQFLAHEYMKQQQQRHEQELERQQQEARFRQYQQAPPPSGGHPFATPFPSGPAPTPDAPARKAVSFRA